MLLNRYYIGRALGQGAFGITYLAWDLNLDRAVAIREYMPTHLCSRVTYQLAILAHTGEDQVHFTHGKHAFLDEARRLAGFSNHPGVVSVTDSAQANGTAYMVMASLQGITLQAYLERQGGQVPFKLALGVLMPVMDTLRELHAAGFLHRDLRPDNVFITTARQVKLVDFGGVRYALRESGNGEIGFLAEIEIPGYWPMECYTLRAEQGPPTEVYTLAATLYRCITGKRPMPAPDRVAGCQLLLPSLHCEDLPSGIETVLLKALALQPADRFQTVADFQQALNSPATEEHPRADLVEQTTVSLDEVCDGCTRSVEFPELGRTLEFIIPPGADTGTRVPAKHSEPGKSGPKVEVVVAPHPVYSRDGKDLSCTVNLSSTDAELGVAVKIPPLGAQKRPFLTVPPRSFAGQRFRLANAGLPDLDPSAPAGDLYITLAVTAPPMSPQQFAPTYALHDMGSITLAAILGGPLGSTYLMAQNYRRLSDRAAANKALAAGVLITAAAVGAGYMLRDSGLVGAPIGTGLVFAMRAAASHYQGPAITNHIARGGRVKSKWLAAGIGLAASVAVFVIFVLGAFLWTRITDPYVKVGNGSEVYYSSPARRDDAVALGNALAKLKDFDQQAPTVLLSRSSEGAGISFVVKDGLWNRSDVLLSFEGIAIACAPSVGGFPIQLGLADTNRRIKKNIEIGRADVGGDSVYYLGAATPTDAAGLGQSLKRSGLFFGKGATVLLEKGAGTTISVILQENAWNDSRTVSVLKTIARRTAVKGDGLPVTLRLLNEAFEIKKEIKL